MPFKALCAVIVDYKHLSIISNKHFISSGKLANGCME